VKNACRAGRPERLPVMPDSAVDPLNTSLATAHAAGGTAPASVTPYPSAPG